MSIITTIRCRQMQRSIAFYTAVLDFECVEDGGYADPTVSVLMRGGSLLLISSHGGDGEFGQAVLVTTDNVDALFRKFRERGLKTPGNPDAPAEVHEGPIDQLACPPALIDRSLVNLCRSVWVPGCFQPTLAELAKQSINIVRRDVDRLPKLSVPAVA